MARDLKRMLDRLAALREARRHLSDGDPARALERLDDGAVEGAKSAERLRRQTLEALAREAQRHLRRGEGERAQAIFEELALYDPELAARVRQGELSAAGLTSLENVSAVERPGASEHEQVPTGKSSGAAFHLAIDEGGELYVHCGERLVLGHAHSESADLPVLADVGPSHVLLERRASLRDGPRWFVHPLSGESLRLGAKLVPAQGSELTPGELLSLAPNCALRLIQPDAASSSVTMTKLHTMAVTCMVESQCAPT